MMVFEEVHIPTREAIIMEWYEEVFPLVAAYVQRQGGSLEEAKEVFQETIVLYYEKLVRADFRPATSDRAYLVGIAKKQWLKYREKHSRHESLERIEMIAESTQEPSMRKLLYYLKQAGEKCMDVLQSFYYENLTMRQVADRFGYTSERSATVQKYKCLEKVRDEIKQKSIHYEDFFE